MRRWIWILLVLIVGALAVWGLSRRGADTGLAVIVAKATAGEFVREVRATGTVEAKVYTLTFPRPGVVARVPVREGQAVERGGLLAELQTAAERDSLASARSALQALQARQRSQRAEFENNLARQRGQLAEAGRRFALNQRLYAVGAVSRVELRESERQTRDLGSQIGTLVQQSASAQSDLAAQVSAREAEIRALERTLAQSQLRATVAGVVSRIDYLPGVQSGTGAVRLIEAGSLEVRLRVAEGDAATLAAGQPASIELDASPGEPLVGKVARLAPQAEVAGTGGSAVLPVVLRFTGELNQRVRPGLTATARVTTLRLRQAVRIPLETLVDEGGKTSVWRVDEAAKTVRKTPVTVKARNLTQAAVEGIEAGAVLVALPPEGLSEGAKVSYDLGEEQ